MPITNDSNISLTTAVWLMHDEYDLITDDNYVSATRLLKPLRHIVLPHRIPKERQTLDVADLVASGLGKSIHDSIEKAWVKGYRESLRKLGYPKDVIDRVLVNPTDELLDVTEHPIPIYLEQRVFREFNGWRIGGKYDMVAEGHLEDNKSTGTYTWVKGGSDELHKRQMSIYRWLDAAQERPRVTEDFGRINYIFTDWQKREARTNPNYPQKRVEHKDFALFTLEETENFVREKLNQIKKYWDAPEETIPHCTDEELWRSAPQYKFYLDPAKIGGRSTRNFDNESEAKKYQVTEKGGRGVVVYVPGEPKRCDYCDAFNICTQKDAYQ